MKFLYLTICVMCLCTYIVHANPIPDKDASDAEKTSVTEEASNPESNESQPAAAEEKSSDTPSSTTASTKVETTPKATARGAKKLRAAAERKPSPTTSAPKSSPATITKSSSAETKASPVAAKVDSPSSNPAEMQIKSWGPKDYEYSFKTDNQRQAKTIHIEDKPENEDNPYEVSDTGSYSSFNDEHGYKYEVEYTAGSNGYRPKVSYSFHS